MIHLAVDTRYRNALKASTESEQLFLFAEDADDYSQMKARTATL
jgi:hypothetical protein